mgnify:CR=1 FL=1
MRACVRACTQCVLVPWLASKLCCRLHVGCQWQLFWFEEAASCSNQFLSLFKPVLSLQRLDPGTVVWYWHQGLHVSQCICSPKPW